MKHLRFTNTKFFHVHVDDETAARLLPTTRDDGTVVAADITTLSEQAQRFERVAAYASHFYDGYIDVDEDETDGSAWWTPDVVDGVNGREKYLWSARHFVMEARHQLSSGRYRDGNCRELDEVNGALAQIEDRLRLMALASDESAS